MTKKIGIIFWLLHAAIISLIVLGLIERVFALYWCLAIIAFLIYMPLKEGLLFFIRSIPLFIALPITNTFDSFNMWRIATIIIFLKWFFQKEIFMAIRNELVVFFLKPFAILKKYKLFSLSSMLIIIAVISLVGATEVTIGLKRIVYFINLGLIAIPIYQLASSENQFRKRIIDAIAIPVILVVIVGFLQLLSTYFIDIYDFVYIWGDKINLNLFGSQWSYIAVNLGNTWFAYFGEELSLRMFSIFPDSHSFPIFVLLGIPSIYVLARNKKYYWLLIISSLLALILSGTRGIWAASIAVLIWFFFITIVLKKKSATLEKIKTFKRFKYVLLIFFSLFVVAYPILASQQFKVHKNDSDLILRRIRSIINFGETSNSQRIEIWKQTIPSILRHPFFGVGIYNFPVIIGKDITLNKAGASAHNIYLHIVAEMGIPALLLSLVIVIFILKKCFNNFISNNDDFALYSGVYLLFLPWVLVYSLTDFALFDERAFLLFMTTSALIISHQKNE